MQPPRKWPARSWSRQCTLRGLGAAGELGATAAVADAGESAFAMASMSALIEVCDWKPSLGTVDGTLGDLGEAGEVGGFESAISVVLIWIVSSVCSFLIFEIFEAVLFD